MLKLKRQYFGLGEESGVLGFPSRRGLTPRGSLECNPAKYWNFSFSISLSSEYSGLISFRIDWFDLLAVHETL